MFFNCGTIEEKGILDLKKGEKYDVKVEFASAPACKLNQGNNVLFGGGAVRIGGAKIIDADEELKHAAALAQDADQVIICAGLNVSVSRLEAPLHDTDKMIRPTGKQKVPTEPTWTCQDTWTHLSAPFQPPTPQQSS